MRASPVVVAVSALGLAVGCGGTAAHVDAGPGAKAARAPAEIAAYGCGSCHTISGISGANAHVGPSLSDFAERRYIAGRLPNTAPNLVEWIRHPQRVDPGNVMPYLGVSESDARDIAAYLYSH
jgi:cytochrome c1